MIRYWLLQCTKGAKPIYIKHDEEVAIDDKAKALKFESRETAEHYLKTHRGMWLFEPAEHEFEERELDRI